jgi:hypothetical protein
MKVTKKRDKNPKNYELIDKNERKKDNNKIYEMYSSAESDQDVDDPEEIKNSSMPMAEKTQLNVRRRVFKPKNIVSDYKSRKEKVDYYLEKCMHYVNKQNKDETFGYTETCTPNKYCHFGINTFSLSQEAIELLEKNHSLLTYIDESRKKLPKEKLIKFRKFKEDFLNLFSDTKLRTLIETRMLQICSKNYKNILVVKNLPKKYSVFSKDIFGGHRLSEDNKCKELERELALKEFMKDDISTSEFFNSITTGFTLAASK